jgi:hypothetical protein
VQITTKPTLELLQEVVEATTVLEAYLTTEYVNLCTVTLHEEIERNGACDTELHAVYNQVLAQQDQVVMHRRDAAKRLVELLDELHRRGEMLDWAGEQLENLRLYITR